MHMRGGGPSFRICSSMVSFFFFLGAASAGEMSASMSSVSPLFLFGEGRCGLWGRKTHHLHCCWTGHIHYCCSLILLIHMDWPCLQGKACHTDYSNLHGSRIFPSVKNGCAQERRRRRYELFTDWQGDADVRVSSYSG